MDLSKAFDTVYQAILSNKLLLIGLTSDACTWFHDYLSDRSQAIVIDGVKSEFRPLWYIKVYHRGRFWDLFSSLFI